MGARFLLGSIAIVAIFIGGIFLSTNIIFEKNEPKLENAQNIPTHWNLQDDISLHFSDESGIHYYRIKVLFDDEILSDEKEVVLNKPKNLSINLPKPKATLKNGVELTYIIEINDWSSSNFFFGNKGISELKLVIDKSPPEVELIASSASIVRGGSVVVAYHISDMSLDRAYLSNGIDEFRLYQDVERFGSNIYLGILAWPLHNKSFKATITAIDKAKNMTQQPITLALNSNALYYKSNINIKPDFLSEKLDEILSQSAKKEQIQDKNDIEKFIFLNEYIRSEDEKRILGSCNDLASSKANFSENFKPFIPLQRAAVVGSFGDARIYLVNKEKISEATHLGVDVASVRNAPVIASNDGIVLLDGKLGLYGNTIVLYHGLGISSLYSHLSTSNVKIGDEIKAGDIIGTTGTTGWAFGDHLHFGILIQGHFVRINDWINSNWVDNNLFSVLDKARAYYLNH